MSPLLTLTITLLSALILPSLSLATVATPTYINSTGEYYIATPSNDFQYATIICSSPHCYINCNAFRSCADSYITASSSSSLTIECTETNACSSAALLIAASDTTTIKCSAYNSCYYSSFNMTTTATVNIQCGPNACLSTTVDANDTQSLNVSCKGSSACDSAQIYADRAQSVSIVAEGSYGLSYSDIHALHASSFSLTCLAKQSDAMYDWQEDNTCYYGSLYVPSSFNLECWRGGCRYLANIHVITSIYRPSVSFHGCDYCGSSGKDCMPSSTIYCDSDWQDDVLSQGVCIGDSCGCNELLSALQNKYIAGSNYPQCPDLIDTDVTTSHVGLAVGVIWVIVCGGICYCVCICALVYFACFKPSKRREPQQLLMEAPPTVQTQPNVIVVNPNQQAAGFNPMAQPYVPPNSAQTTAYPVLSTGNNVGVNEP